MKLAGGAGALLALAVFAISILELRLDVGTEPNLVVLTSGGPDLEQELAVALNRHFPRLATQLPPDPGKSNEELAHALASKMRNYPAEYNKPSTLMLGDSTAFQFAIKTNKLEPSFEGLEGRLAAATVLVANDVSAQLNGPPDRLQITLRGDKMRTISSPVPLTWIWDVKPLKPGPAHVTLEVTSYIKSGKDTQPVPIRVLQDTWVVDARGMEWAKYQIERIAPIQAFIFGIGATVVAALAWFGFSGFGKRKSDFET
jgi:hypothetical protein